MEHKPKRRMSARELLLSATPFPVMWIVLGLTVDSAVFKFWQTGQRMSSLAAVMLQFVPIAFTFLYSFIIYTCYRNGRRIDWPTVAISAVFSYLLACIFCPIP